MGRVRAIENTRPADSAPGQVWYTSYGSNMHLDRLSSYLAGGRPPGALRTYPGCRDHRAPEASVAVELQGVLYFATRSPVWLGGRAFYDPDARGRVRARAHLVTAGQFSDIAAQEMYRAPGADLDLGEVLGRGTTVLGGGRYERLVCPGTLDGVPLLTFTAPWGLHDVPWERPSAAYLRHLATGLLEAGPWEVPDIAEYLTACPGAAGNWTAPDIAALLEERDVHGPS